MANYLTLKKSNCKNCYKCIRHCPVKSIRFSGNQAHIIGNECILCGQCFVICPQNAKEIHGEREKVKVLIQSGAPVDSFVTPVPWAMPGYEDEVIMAAGAFVQGASIELSADAPMREPYVCYMQGGLTYPSGKAGILLAAEKIRQAGYGA